MARKKMKDFSGNKPIWEQKEENLLEAYNNFLNWYFQECFISELNPIASQMIVVYLTYLEEIKKELKFPSNFDLKLALDNLNFFIPWMKVGIRQTPRGSDIKAHIKELEKLTQSLSAVLHKTLPIIIDEFNNIHDKIYPQKWPEDIQATTSKLRYELNKLNEIRHSIASKIGEELNQQLNANTTAVIDCLDRKGISILKLIELVIPVKKLMLIEGNFITSLKQILRILQDHWPIIISAFGKDTGGRPRAQLARDFLLGLASIIENATGKKPTAYKSIHNMSGYDGTLYKLAMKCAPLFKSTNLDFFNHPASVGDLSLKIAPYYKTLKIDKDFPDDLYGLND